MPWFRKVVLGEGYAGVEGYYSILIVGVMVALACAPPFTALYALGRSRVVASFEGVRLVLTVVFGLLVVPRYGAWGMAVVMAGSRSVAAVLLYVYAHQLVKRMTHLEDSESKAA